ncbi:MAG: SHOCT domain-containing protein [Capsulimonadales bacterium]|nr:SHOCT domain-containing protein [Capsulimonadales bacterium]
MLGQNFRGQNFDDRTPLSEAEMRRVMDLHDERTGLGSAASVRRAASADVSAANRPTVGDVAELLGVTPAEVLQLLGRVREEERQRAARRAEMRVPTPPQVTTGAPTYSAAPPGTTVIQNVIVDSHAHLFRRFEDRNGHFTATWNWGAFWFGPLWYFYKGMWAKGLLYTLLYFTTVAPTFGTVTLLFPLFLALMGNFDYYLLRCHDTQLWDRKRTLPRAPWPVSQAAPTPSAGTFESGPGVVAEPDLHQTARKLQVLRETYDRGLITQSEFEEKRLALLNEVENHADLKRLAEAHRLGLLTEEEYEIKRAALLYR